MPMSTIGKTQITITFIAPSEHVAEGDRIFASHGCVDGENTPQGGRIGPTTL